MGGGGGRRVGDDGFFFAYKMVADANEKYKKNKKSSYLYSIAHASASTLLYSHCAARKASAASFFTNFPFSALEGF